MSANQPMGDDQPREPLVRPAGFLVVEDDELAGRFLTHFFSRYGETHLVPTMRAAREGLERLPNLAAIIVDVNLPDGSGLDFVREARESHPALTVLVLTGADERELANRAQALGAEFVYKPPGKENLERFARRVSAAHISRMDSLADLIAQYSSANGLSPQESRVLTLSISGVSRSELHTHLAVSENTLKTLVRRLLAKVGARNLDELCRTVMHQALFT